MRTLFFSLTTILLVAVLLVGCDSFVEDVDLPIDSIEDAQLNDESQVPFVLNGIRTRFATTHDQLSLFADGLSDQFIFDQRVPNATFPSYREMDEGDIQFANNSLDGAYNDLGELRFFSDNLIARLGGITFEDAALQREAQFVGTFYGGVARYFFATYIGLTQREGGGVISDDPDNPGPFIPAAEMYSLALEKLNTAIGFAGEYEVRVVNTLIARIHLYQGNFSAARAAAQNGLRDGDDPFTSRHSVESTNLYWSQAGPGRNQWVADFKYNDIVTADPAEAVRVPLTAISGNDDPPTTFYRQAKYVDRSTPLPFATWQENELMLAELDLRDGSTAAALPRVNAVRASYGLDALASIDLDGLVFEREKELFAQGMRLADQRRFDLWHLGPNTWWYLPITQGERNQNDNF